jgi:hypothetical protein
MDNYYPITGKTYGLFGEEKSTNPYYSEVISLTGELLDHYSFSEPQLLEFVQNASRKILLSIRRKVSAQNGKLSYLLNRLHDSLSSYTPGADDHIRSSPVYKYITDNLLMTSRDQYHLYMIEIELVNRIYLEKFLSANFRIALLPYCLSESPATCKAEPDEIDIVCRKCLKSCYINLVSQSLEEKGIHPYILSRGNLEPMFRKMAEKHGSFGVLGIACIAELVSGMRRCMRAGVPVVGIPLNANRCPRWMGDFYENSVDLEELGNLITPDHD